MKNDTHRAMFVAQPQPGDILVPTREEVERCAFEIATALSVSRSSVVYLEGRVAAGDPLQEKLAEYRARVERLANEVRAPRRDICVRRPINGGK